MKVVLLVDDDSESEALARLAIERSGALVKVISAIDGVEALKILHPADGHISPIYPDLVLLDVKMPRIGGVEVLEKLFESGVTRFTTIVMLSTDDNPETVSECYGAGARAYLSKNQPFPKFCETIKTCLEFWLMNATPAPKPERLSV